MASDEGWRAGHAAFGACPADDPHGRPGAGATVASGPLAAQFAELAAGLQRAETLTDVLHAVVAAAAAVIPGADAASVTLLDDSGRLDTPVYTGRLAERLDRLQYALGEGPCVEMAHGGPTDATFSADLAAETRWGRFGPEAVERGGHGALSTVLIPQRNAACSAAMNVYSQRRDGLGVLDRDLAVLLAAHASVAVAAARAVRTAEARAHHLERALRSRDVIGQAKGILMQRRGVSAEEAFAMLRRTSQELNVKLTDVAETLASRRAEL
jgi:hypothetical protein